MNRTVRIAVGVLVLVLVAGGSFYGGTVYGRGQAQAAGSARLRAARGTDGGAAGQFAAGQRGAGQGGMLFGQIQDIGDGTLTITDNSGAQRKVQVTDTTLIQKQASVTLADLQTGESVIVSGSTGSDGSITARSVQVAPAGRFGGPDGQPYGNRGSAPAGTNP